METSARQIATPFLETDWVRIAARIAERASTADKGAISLLSDLQDLAQSGLLLAITDYTGISPKPLCATKFFRRLGRVSLPVGRIVEGHVNALKLIALYGTKAQVGRSTAQAKAGVFFGVWGADGTPAASFVDAGGAEVELNGIKRFCSGIGMVGQAVLSVDGPDGIQLLITDVSDQQRGDISQWQVRGMRATMSGTYLLDGVKAEKLGRPGDYYRAPHFEGGIWRYAALHTGALEALAEIVRRHLGASPDPHQMHRLSRLVMLADTARLHVDAAAIAVELGTDVQAAVVRSLLAREAVEQACLGGLAIAERALGTSAFRAESRADLCRRDLAFFLRLANLDGKLTGAAELLAKIPKVGEIW